MVHTSVIMPVYNTAAYLREAVESILAQTDPDFELLLIDDGSTDGSLELLEEYARRCPRCRLLRQNHGYQGAARNLGLAQARGKYVYFMDSDDAADPELLADCFALCEEQELEGMIFDAEEFSDDGTPLDGFYGREGLDNPEKVYTGPEFWAANFNRGGVFFTCWSHYLRRDFLLEHAIRFETAYFYEDNIWALRLYLEAERLGYRHRKLYRYRRRAASTTGGEFHAPHLAGRLHLQQKLEDLLWEVRDDPQRVSMIRSTYMLNLPFFQKLREVDEPDELEALITEFLRESCDALASERPAELQDLRAVALARTLLAVRGWRRCEELERAWQRAWYTLRTYYRLGEAGTVFYGLGAAAAEQLPVLNGLRTESDPPFVYMETRPNGAAFDGETVHSAAELDELRPGCVLVSSFKYFREICGVVREHCPEAQCRCLW